MSKTKTRVERFDEAFKMLLIVMTLTLSANIGLYKEIMEPKSFSYTIWIFAITIVIWAYSTLSGGKDEYVLKALAWYFLMLAFGVFFARLRFTVFLLPPLVVSLIVLVGLALTLPILWYLKEIIGEKEQKRLTKVLFSITLLLIVLDTLYFLGLVTFPLF